MATYTIFCSACDRNVAIEPRSPDWTWLLAVAPETQGEVACFEYGVRCTGTCCPLLAVGPERRDTDRTVRGGARPPN